MPNYFIEDHNIITFDEYFKNILSYQYSEFIEINEKNYLDEIRKDYQKDFFCSMIDNNIEPRWNENLLDKLEEYNSPFDYLIIDCENLQSYIETHDIFTWLIFDFVINLDMERVDKFHFIHSIIRSNVDFVIKLKRVSRNIKYYPLSHDTNAESFLCTTEDYRYDGLDI